MDKNVYRALNDYYHQKGIHPDHFQCPHQSVCRQNAYFGNMTEAKMSMVGSAYGTRFPKIVVISLDPPSGKDQKGENKRWNFTEPSQRTIEYISSTHENDDYWINRPNPHWAMTQIIIKDLLLMWGYRSKPNAATVLESYSGRLIENVSAYFAHV